MGASDGELSGVLDRLSAIETAVVEIRERQSAQDLELAEKTERGARLYQAIEARLTRAETTLDAGLQRVFGEMAQFRADFARHEEREMETIGEIRDDVRAAVLGNGNGATSLAELLLEDRRRSLRTNWIQTAFVLFVVLVAVALGVAAAGGPNLIGELGSVFSGLLGGSGE